MVEFIAQKIPFYYLNRKVQSSKLSKIYFPHFNTLHNSPHNSFECVKLSFIRSETNFGGDPIGH